MIVDFPPELPCVLRENYSFQHEQRTLTTSLNGNPKAYRAFNKNAPRLYSVQWQFTQDEFQIFHYWFEVTAMLGAASFRLQLRDEDGLAEKVVRFVGIFGWELLGNNRYRVNAQLEEWQPRPAAPPIVLGDIVDGGTPADEWADIVDGAAPGNEFTDIIDGGTP